MLYYIKNAGKSVFYGINNKRQVPIFPGGTQVVELIPEIQRRVNIGLAEIIGEFKEPKLKKIVRKTK